jgi:hypothetical protein
MKKKLKHTTPRTEAKSAGLLPQRMATKSTTSKKVSATVVELMWSRNGLRKAVTAALPNTEPMYPTHLLVNSFSRTLFI